MISRPPFPDPALKLSARGLGATLLVLFLAAGFVRLGFWQLDRLEQRRARNAEWRQALVLPELVLDSALVDQLVRTPGRFVNRRVIVHGDDIAEGEVLLRGRVHAGRPGVHIVSPLALRKSPHVVLVNRGWAPAPDGATADVRPLAEPGARRVRGVLQRVPPAGEGGAPLEVGPPAARRLSLRRLDPEPIRARIGRPILPLYVQQLSDPTAPPPSRLTRVALPELSEGNHLNYAVQWFSFAAIALVGLVILALRSRRRAAP